MGIQSVTEAEMERPMLMLIPMRMLKAMVIERLVATGMTRGVPRWMAMGTRTVM